MNVQKLRALLAAVHCGSISKAAETVGYTESGLTYAINSFESELGIQLIRRSKTGVRLSEEGKELLPYLEALVKSDAEVMRKIEEISCRKKNVLRLALYPGLSDGCLFDILAAFSAKMPETEISLRSESIRNTVEGLKTGEIDIGLNFEDVAATEDIKCMKLCSFPGLVILPESRAAEAEKPFPISRFRDESMIVFDVDEKELPKYGFFPATVIKTSGTGCASLFSAVEKGLAITSVPSVLIDGCKYHVCFTPVSPPVSGTLYALYRAADERRGAVCEFLKCLKEWAKKQENK